MKTTQLLLYGQVIAVCSENDINKKGNVHKVNIEARSRNHCCRGKAMSIKFYE
jgi:hypothetical protein